MNMELCGHVNRDFLPGVFRLGLASWYHGLIDERTETLGKLYISTQTSHRVF
jgi:hypothetical protein